MLESLVLSKTNSPNATAHWICSRFSWTHLISAIFHPRCFGFHHMTTLSTASSCSDMKLNANIIPSVKVVFTRYSADTNQTSLFALWSIKNYLIYTYHLRYFLDLNTDGIESEHVIAVILQPLMHAVDVVCCTTYTTFFLSAA